MGTRSLAALVAVFVLVTSTLTQAPAARAAGYVKTTTATEISSDGYYASSAVDAAGAIHVAFLRYLQPGVWFATNASGAWVVSRITALAGSTKPALAVDAQQRAHVAFGNESATPGIRYATNRSGSWVVSRLTEAATDRFPSIAVDPLGEAHIAYGEGELVYLTDRRGTWDGRRLKSSDANRPSITLDVNRRVHIAYARSGGGTGGISHITDASGAWVTTQVSATGTGASIAVNGVTPRIAFVRANDGVGGGVFYATKGTAWTESTVEGGYFNDITPSLRVNTAGKAWIAYEGVAPIGGTQVVRMATNASGSWVRSGLGNGGAPTMMLEPSGRTHVTFSTTALYVRSSTTKDWSATTVAVNSYDTQPDVATGPDDLPRIAYISQYMNEGLRFGTWDGTRFVPARITTATDREPSLVIDPDGHAHVAFVRQASSMELWYGTDATGTWAFTKVDSTANMSCPAIALGPDGAVHIAAYHETHDGGYIYPRISTSTNATGTWVSRQDAPIVSWPGCPDLVVDAGGVEHVVYSNGTAIAYAKLMAGSWVGTSFGNGANLSHPQIAFADDGSVLISYTRPNQYDSATGGLWLRSNATGTWTSALIGKTASAESPHGLTVAGDGSVHIAYRGFIWDPGLHYLTDEGGAWRTTRVLPDDIGAPAIGVAADGRADIVFAGGGSGLTAGAIHARE